MRILFLNYEFPPIGGGGANANAYLFREFARHPQLQIDCVTSTMGTRDEQVRLTDNINLYRLVIGKGQLHFWTQREVLTWLWRADHFVANLLKQRRYDLCHAFFGFPAGAVAWRRRDTLPYLVSLRGSDVPGFNPRFGLHYLLLKPLFRRIWRESKSLIANSSGLQRLANSFMPELPISIIPNGIDTSEFTPAAPGERIPGRILCVSRLVERKGVHDLIVAMPKVVERCPETHLLVVGEGDQLHRLKQRSQELNLADRITFCGYVPHEQLPDLYRSAELFVQPSFYEGMSNTVLEAMASGLPIIATGEGGREELFGENALTAPFGQPGTLAEGVTTLLQDKARRTSMGTLSREIAKKYSWEEVASGYLALYRSLLNGFHRGDLHQTAERGFSASRASRTKS